GRILEKDAQHQGKLRGMSGSQVARMGASFLWSQIRPGKRTATNMEEYYLLRYGQAYYDYFVYGFARKFGGLPLTGSPSPEGEVEIPRLAFLRNRLGLAKTSTVIAAPDKPGGKREVRRHPARGTQQIIDRC